MSPEKYPTLYLYVSTFLSIDSAGPCVEHAGNGNWDYASWTAPLERWKTLDAHGEKALSVHLRRCVEGKNAASMWH